MVIAVYPGTFDPLTRGHEDLVRRAGGLFTKLVVGVADSRAKKPFFDLNERIAIAREVLSHYPNIWDKSGVTHESHGNVMVMCNGHFLPLGFIRMDAAWMDRTFEPYVQPFSAAIPI